MKNLETKKEIRANIKKKRASLPAEVRQAFSTKITEAVLSHPLYQDADEIYCYVSFGDEVSTLELLTACWDSEKKVAVPKILEVGTMEFFYIDSIEELSEGYYGIQEPKEINQADGRNVLVIMPGVAFDKQGGRLGYGKGFYDKYLQRHPGYHRMALAFEIQCMDFVPTDVHDIHPELIVTEKESYIC